MEQAGMRAGGRAIQLVTLDTSGQPSLARTKLQELVEREKVAAVLGPMATIEMLAIDDYVRRGNVPVISGTAAAEDLTQRKLNSWYVRANGTSAQASHPFGEYAAKEMRLRKIVIAGDDIAISHEAAAGFQRTFEENGGQIVQKIWTPLNAADYASYIAQLPSDADGVLALYFGGNGVKFVKQYREYGVKAQLLGGVSTTDEGILRVMGDEALDVVSASYYQATTDNAANRAYVQAYRQKFNDDPGNYSAGNYVGCQFLLNAIDAVQGRAEDAQALIKALRAVRIENSLYGSLRLDDLHQPILDIAIRKVERKDGKLQNTILKTYPAVSQFWTYDPKAFLAGPVYSRDWKPVR
jgi:branched-chain amino acid transport system substrate-binding protein